MMNRMGKDIVAEFEKAYHLPNPELHERFEFREIRVEETDQAAEMEYICFPPNEACTREMMAERIAKAPEMFLVAVDRETGKLAGFLSGLSTDEERFRDEFFTDAGLYDPDGKNIMLLGLNVLPRELMYLYLRREQENGRREVFLTCAPDKIEMYRKMGFQDEGISDSTWGGSLWHDMRCVIRR